MPRAMARLQSTFRAKSMKYSLFQIWLRLSLRLTIALSI
jgi:hypothetical protein